MSDRAVGLVRKDVRWRGEQIERASALATARGVGFGVVVREAVDIGLDRLERAAVSAPLQRRVPRSRAGAERVFAEASEVVAKMRGAGSSTPPGEGDAGADAPRPSASAPAVPLWAVVARLVGRNVSGPIPPVDRLRARKAIEAGRVTVAGVVVRDPSSAAPRDQVRLLP